MTSQTSRLVDMVLDFKTEAQAFTGHGKDASTFTGQVRVYCKGLKLAANEGIKKSQVRQITRVS